MPPILQAFSFGEKALNPGQVVTQPCSVVEGDPPLKLTWMHNEEITKPHSGITVINIGDRSAILSISALSDYHAGNYTCIAENQAGKATVTSTLVINGIFISVY